MADSPRRHISVSTRGDPWRYHTVQGHRAVPIQGEPWRYQTVQRHIAHPPRLQRRAVPVQRDPWRYQTVQGHITHPPRLQHRAVPVQGDHWTSHTVHGHISAPVATQRKRHRNPSSDSPHHATARRRRVEPEPTPTRSLIDAYNKRKAATARFPPRITPQHIRAAMRRYEQIVQGACAGVETSCASCGEFMARAESELIPVDDDRVHSMKTTEGVTQLDNCSLVDGSYQVCQACFNALNGHRSSHKRHCSCYVQLTRVRSLQDLSLLQPVTLKDLNGKPDKLLGVEDQRIAQLAASTEIEWEENESSAEFRLGRASRKAADDH